MDITKKQYLSFINDFLTVGRFASYYDLSIEAARSIIARSKVIYISELASIGVYQHYSIDYAKFSPANGKMFKARDEKRLLAEHSA